MPELPEVEIARRLLREWIGDRTILSISGEPSRVLGGLSTAEIDAFVRRRRLTGIDRLGKNLLFVLDDNRGLSFHLGMSGRFLLRSRGTPPPDHGRLDLEVEGERIVAYVDARMFGKITIGRADAMRAALAHRLGPDPLEHGLEPRDLMATFATRRRPIKGVLLDQSVIAGLGNIQASEALHRARLHPDTPAVVLDLKAVSRLIEAIRASIADTLDELARTGALYLRDGAENRFRVYGRQGDRCLSCRVGTIERSVRGGRATFHCPRCQPEAQASRFENPLDARGG